MPRALPLDAAVRSPEQTVRAAWLAYTHHGLDGMLEHCHDDVTWRSFLANGRVTRGHDGVRAMFAGLRAQGVDQVSVPYRYGTVSGRVLVSVDVETTTGPMASVGSAVILYEVRDGRIAGLEEFLTARDARAAAAALA